MDKEFIRRAITAAAGILPLRRRILFESSPDLACNTYPVFCELLADPAMADTDLVWLVKEPALWQEKYPQKNVRFVAFDPADPRQKRRAIRLSLTSRCVVFCNKVLWPPRRGQLCLSLGHGSPIKQCKGTYTPGRFCNRWLYPSEGIRETMEEQLGYQPGQGLCFGYPRNDALLHPAGALDKLVDRAGRRTVFWLPTFRQHQQSSAANYTLPGCGLPLLTEEGALERLNACLQKENVLLILKPHPVQDMSAIRAGSFSNFVLLYDDDLRREGVQLYEALADADALLTDYSSVYCDYLLTGRPIGLTFDDLAQYGQNRGFVAEDIRTLVKGRELYTFDDLAGFIGEVSRGEDPAAEARRTANDYYNDVKDGSSAARTAAYVRDFMKKGKE